MKTANEISALKRAWRNDPCWDIEQTEGFEDHYEELLEYRKKWDDIWENESTADLEKRAEKMGIPGNPDLARYIEMLELRIDKLESEIQDLKINAGLDSVY